MESTAPLIYHYVYKNERNGNGNNEIPVLK